MSKVTGTEWQPDEWRVVRQYDDAGECIEYVLRRVHTTQRHGISPFLHYGQMGSDDLAYMPDPRGDTAPHLRSELEGLFRDLLSAFDKPVLVYQPATIVEATILEVKAKGAK